MNFGSVAAGRKGKWIMAKKALCILLLVVILLCTGCAAAQSDLIVSGDGESVNNPTTASLSSSMKTYDYDKLYEYKNESDEEEFANLLALLQTPKMLPVSCDSSTDGLLKITFSLSLGPGEIYRVNNTAQAQDITVLFALLDDVKTIDWGYSQLNYGLGAPYSRAQMDEAFGDTIALYGKNRELFTHAFVDKVEVLKYNPEVKSDISYDYDVIGSHK